MFQQEQRKGLNAQYHLVQRFNACIAPRPLLLNGTSPRTNGPLPPPNMSSTRVPGSSPSFSPGYHPLPPNSFLANNSILSAPPLGAAPLGTVPIGTAPSGLGPSPSLLGPSSLLPTNQQSTILGQLNSTPPANSHHTSLSPVFNPSTSSAGPPPGWPTFNSTPPSFGSNSSSAFSTINSKSSQLSSQYYLSTVSTFCWPFKALVSLAKYSEEPENFILFLIYISQFSDSLSNYQLTPIN